MTFKNTAKIASGLLIASVALVGCSSDEEPTDETTPVSTEEASTPAEEPTTEASTPAEEPSQEASEPASSEPSAGGESQGPVKGGDTFTGTGYTLVIPEGWESNDSLGGGATEILITKTGGATTDSINVITTAAGGTDLDTLVPQAKKQLESQATEISDAPEKTVDGEPAKGFQGTLTAGDLPFAQYYIIKDDQAYVVTFGGPDGAKAVDTFFEGWTFS